MGDITILIVDDEQAIREMITTALEIEDMVCLHAADAQAAHCIAVDKRPSLILLDWMLPGISGVEFAQRLKRQDSTQEIPIIMLTAKSEEHNRIRGLESGVEDYITKPFSVRELILRIKSVLKRCYPDLDGKALVVDKLRLDPVGHRISVGDQAIQMGPTEYRLLEFFMKHPERAYSRAQLLDQVWGGNVYVEDRTVDVHIRRLRKALTPFGYAALVQTVRGTGYRFSENLER